MRKEDVIGWNIEVAETFWTRLRGLLGKKKLILGEGMLLKPCRQIHTWFMSIPIDVVFLDERGRIVELRSHMEPGKKSPHIKNGYQVLELPAGTIEKFDLQIDQKLDIILT